MALLDLNGRNRGLMGMHHEESKIQESCVAILKYRYSHLAWNHSPNEGKRSEFQGKVLKGLGMTNGWPDLEILHDGTVLFVEFKTRTGRQSEAQKDVQKVLEGLGYVYVICRSVVEFSELCHKYLGPERDPDREQLKRILSQR